MSKHYLKIYSEENIRKMHKALKAEHRWESINDPYNIAIFAWLFLLYIILLMGLTQ